MDMEDIKELWQAIRPHNMETTLGEIMIKRVQRLQKLDQFHKKEIKKMSKQCYLEVKTLCDDSIAEIKEEKKFWTNLQNKSNSLLSEESKEKFDYKYLETKYNEIFNDLEREIKGYEDLLQTIQKYVKETQRMLLGLEPADRFILQVDPESTVDLNILEVKIGDQ